MYMPTFDSAIKESQSGNWNPNEHLTFFALIINENFLFDIWGQVINRCALKCLSLLLPSVAFPCLPAPNVSHLKRRGIKPWHSLFSKCFLSCRYLLYRLLIKLIEVRLCLKVLYLFCFAKIFWDYWFTISRSNFFIFFNALISFMGEHSQLGTGNHGRIQITQEV